MKSILMAIIALTSINSFADSYGHLIDCALKGGILNEARDINMEVNLDFKFIKWKQLKGGGVDIVGEKTSLENSKIIHTINTDGEVINTKISQYIEFSSLDRENAIANYHFQIGQADTHLLSIDLNKIQTKVFYEMEKMNHKAVVKNLNTGEEYQTLCLIRGPAIQL